MEKHFPSFSCPMCRTFANLDADVENFEELPTLEKILADAEPGPEVSWSEKRERRKSLKAIIAGSKVVQSLIPIETTPEEGEGEAVPAMPPLESVPVPTMVPPVSVLPDETSAPVSLSPSNALGRGTSLAINTSIHGGPPSLPSLNTMSSSNPWNRVGADPLLTAVSPQSLNPFLTFGLPQQSQQELEDGGDTDNATPTTSTPLSPWNAAGARSEDASTPRDSSPSTPGNMSPAAVNVWAPKGITEAVDEEGGGGYGAMDQTQKGPMVVLES